MLANMTATDILEWSIIEQLEPFGETRQDYRFQVLISQLINTIAAIAGEKLNTKPEDYNIQAYWNAERKNKTVSQETPHPKAQKPEQMMALLDSIMK